ncbi:MAG: competence/damage-inducible protein A [Oscillospiraceae bacterium]|nr:competence/damage-inducible protein A [Oscillospiraceae bacterium]
MNAEILCVGTELLLGSIVNTNAAFLSRELANLGVFTYYQSVVGDNSLRLKESLALSLSRSDIVIITGGLGPTYDDLTKETAADYFGLEMRMHEESLERLEKFFAQFNREMTPNNKKQALMPEGCVVFPNNYGTAPGLAIISAKNQENQENKNKTVIMLPGPPRELEPMFEEEVRPFLLKLKSRLNNSRDNIILTSKNVNIFGMGESQVEHKLRGFMQNSQNPTVAPYAKTGEVELRVTASGRDEKECLDLINPAVEKIKAEIGEFVYGVDVKSLQNAVVLKLREKNLTLATAESCTGGLIGKRITEIPGCSSVYLGGVIAYDNNIKISRLNIKEETLEKYGAVSEQTALEMCRGAAENLKSDIGVSTTGIAGPDGGTDDKPVGLVYVGVYYKDKETGGEIHKAARLNLSRRTHKDERELIRLSASSHALYEVLRLFS